ncbi:MAG TPA: penicillin-insensitive murein endopeptidase [Polyangiaceae bacterium]
MLALLCGCGRAITPAAAPAGSHAVTSTHLAAAVEPEVNVSSAIPESTTTDEGEAGEGEGDDAESADASQESAPTTHPLDGWSSEQIDRAVARDLGSLGAMSVGTPNAGILINGVQAKPSELYTLVSPSGAWGTSETLEYLDRAVKAVHAEFPGTPPLALGDIGARHGGPLRPHISHQAGRDLDISFYYRGENRWYARGTRDNLDLPRTWAFVRALIADTDVDLILIDHSIQDLLKEYALGIGEDRDWIDAVFPGKGSLHPIIHHAPGHDTHIHVRFFNPIAQETGRRCYVALVAHNVISAPEQFASHVAKKGETLAMLAKKYGVSVRTIRNANHLKSTLIQEKVAYRIPIRAALLVAPTHARIPPRRPPPPRKKPTPAVSAGLTHESSSG